MKFEEALAAMRAGKKIRYKYMPDDEYYQGCYVGLNPEIFDVAAETFEESKQREMSIVWMKGDKEHPDMRTRWNPYDPKTDPCKHGMCPQLNLLWIMDDNWEIIDENI